jgi:hypothetical protein
VRTTRGDLRWRSAWRVGGILPRVKPAVSSIVPQACCECDGYDVGSTASSSPLRLANANPVSPECDERAAIPKASMRRGDFHHLGEARSGCDATASNGGPLRRGVGAYMFVYCSPS